VEEHAKRALEPWVMSVKIDRALKERHRKPASAMQASHELQC